MVSFSKAALLFSLMALSLWLHFKDSPAARMFVVCYMAEAAEKSGSTSASMAREQCNQAKKTK